MIGLIGKVGHVTNKGCEAVIVKEVLPRVTDDIEHIGTSDAMVSMLSWA